jgi:hypothetical protein
MKYSTAKEKRYDKQHRDCKIKLIITPAKLLYPDEPMKKLYTPEEYSLSCEKLREILQEIEFISGVNIWSEVSFRRIDIAKDIETPSDRYSEEVIRMAKKALHKTGYHLWIPTAEDIEKTGWKEENSILYRNHNQEVCAKIYNKLADMEDRGYDKGELKGLLRFELSLKRQYLQARGFLKEAHTSLDQLPCLLASVLAQASILLETHLATPFWSGAMLSRDLQKIYIRSYCKNKEQRRKNMLAYRRRVNKDGLYDDPIMEKHFAELMLSPFYVSDEVRYISSFADLLTGTRDERVERFLMLHKSNT